jgi:hypothetical protein
MDKVDWSKAPDWADRYIFSQLSGNSYFSDGKNIFTSGGKEVLVHSGTSLIEMRPDEWKEVGKRMEQIAQNGNDGLVYDELEDYSKQPRYKGDDGLDHIDEFARDNSIEDFRAAMRFTIDKYKKRLGKKDAMSKELYKMSDYYKRWSEVEKKLEQEKGE